MLAQDKADEKLLVDAFVRLKEGGPEAAVVNFEEYEKAEMERAERFLEVKSQSIAFRRSVARELDQGGLTYEQEFSQGIYVTDFLIRIGGKRIALECKFNVQRDFDKTLTISKILKERLQCEQVYIVVPFLDDLSHFPKEAGVLELRGLLAALS